MLMAGGLPALSTSTAAADVTTPTTSVLAGVAGPSLTSPVDIRTQASPESNPLPYVVLQWAPVVNADHYVVDISPDEDWTNNAVVLPDKGELMGHFIVDSRKRTKSASGVRSLRLAVPAKPEEFQPM